MIVEIVPIESIHPDPANCRTHSDRNLSGIAGSLKRFGQQRPILVGRDDTIIAGNGTFKAAKSLGWTEIKIIRTDLQGAERAAYGVADNRLSDPEQGSTWDTAALASTLAALQAEDASLATVTGFTVDELVALVSGGAGTIPEGAEGQEFTEEAADDVAVITCPHCGKEFPHE